MLPPFRLNRKPDTWLLLGSDDWSVICVECPVCTHATCLVLPLSPAEGRGLSRLTCDASPGQDNE